MSSISDITWKSDDSSLMCKAETSRFERFSTASIDDKMPALCRKLASKGETETA
jgi:hypothetical protein